MGRGWWKNDFIRHSTIVPKIAEVDGTFYFLLLDDYLIGTFEDSLIV